MIGQIQTKSTLLFADIYEEAAKNREAIIENLKKFTPSQLAELRQLTDRVEYTIGADLFRALGPAIMKYAETQSGLFGLAQFAERLARKYPSWAKNGLCEHKELTEYGACTFCHKFRSQFEKEVGR